MKLGILGPLLLERTDRGGPYNISARQLRVLMGTLLIEQGRVVSAQRLIDELWGGEPPRTARTALQVYVSKLRKILDLTARGPHVPNIVTQAPGYLIRLDGVEFDMASFEEDRRRADDAEACGELTAASDHLDAALRHWRGPALADIRTTPRLSAHAVHLDERRMSTYEKRVRIGLDLGRSGELIGELYVKVEEHPLHETLREYLMTALYRHGRPVDALEVYANYRVEMQDRIGMEPGPRLRELQLVVLSGRPLGGRAVVHLGHTRGRERGQA